MANQVTVPIEPDGTVRLFNHNGSVHVIADVQAYYGDNMWATNPFLTTTPTRVLDTRAGSGGQIGPDGTVRVKVRGVAGVPDTARAVLVNVTATGPSAGGFLTAYASGDKRPATSVVNFTSGATVPNLAWVPIGVRRLHRALQPQRVRRRRRRPPGLRGRRVLARLIRPTHPHGPRARRAHAPVVRAPGPRRC
ncbi:hypothetical protein GCM10010193_08770 [Kitasatospora atroaurantiaca]|uniref:Uncharacterized protein n=1 Tax=Kitasatospora atroaurantiaca TaxID=285545 RepID=A0A561ERU6_9ACTN|nr:hypothetical protein [Kitasatospora atroaurantiaca]TWE18333.1 hypothetical protein FB465_3400 [Kitasatospora atroaurantiaca]